MTRVDQRYEGYGEAQVHDLLPPCAKQQYSRFTDANTLRAPETLTTVFEYNPTITPFSGEEQLVFAAAFKETPKEFVMIAAVLPRRTEKNCTKHYYSYKWDGRFKTKSANEVVSEKAAAARNIENQGAIQSTVLEKERPRRILASTIISNPQFNKEQQLGLDADRWRVNIPEDSYKKRWDPNIPPIDQEVA